MSKSSASDNDASSLEKTICCCDRPLVFKKEDGPKEAYYLPEHAECGICRLNYEISPTGHIYVQEGREYDSMFCKQDGGILERRLHLFKARGFPGGIGWEFVVYCPRHERPPEEFLKDIYPKEDFMKMFGMPELYQIDETFPMEMSALFVASMKRKKR
ncbi:MAG: hypothetical protein HGA85_08250 [Nanoarchaeota archaeon]|nr:hypothetical protein [Nanoarchaeota archaeon]